MACNNCNETQDPNCGCTSEALHINQICNPIECPSDECSESFSAACIRYTGANLTCDNITIVATDTNVAQAISNIVSYICTNNLIEEEILCGQEVVVPANTSVENALALAIEFFCNQFTINTDLQCPESPTVVVPVGTLLEDAIQLVFEHFCSEIETVLEQIANINFPVDNIVAGSGISVTSNTVGLFTTFTITNNDTGSAVTLTSAGGSQSLVNDGTGPALAVKGLTPGIGIVIASTATDITITNSAPDQVVSITAGSDISVTGTYPNFTIAHTGVKAFADIYTSGGIGTSTIVPHNLNLSGFNCVVSVIDTTGLPPYLAYVHGIDYTYTVDGPNQITITDLTGIGAIRVTVIGD